LKNFYQKDRADQFRILITVFAVLTVLIVLSPGITAAKDRSRVLFISSYHPGFPTFFQQVEGIKTAFEGQDILLDIEFMDTKRFPEPVNREFFQTSLTYKLDHTDPYDVVLVGDDNAFVFALEQQAKLFKEKPIVFLGVNNIDRALEQNANPNVSGVVEAVSLEDTIRLMIKLRPAATEIVALVDNTPSGQGDLKSFYQAAKGFRSHKFSDISLADMAWPEFFDTLTGIGKQSVVLLLSAYKDKNNTTLVRTFFDHIDLINGCAVQDPANRAEQQVK